MGKSALFSTGGNQEQGLACKVQVMRYLPRQTAETRQRGTEARILAVEELKQAEGRNKPSLRNHFTILTGEVAACYFFSSLLYFIHMKYCYKCKTDKPKKEYYLDKKRYDGLCQRCKDCERERKLGQRSRNKESHRKRNIRYYQKNKEIILKRSRIWGKDNKEKMSAHKKVANALLRGTLIRPTTCENCDEIEIDAHHDDYTKPLEVKWLCRSCHMKKHNK